MKFILCMTCLFFSAGKIYAQGIKDILNRAKSDVQQQATQKVNQQIDHTITLGIDKGLDNTLYKLFPKPTGSVFTANNPGTPQTKVTPIKKAVSTNGKPNANGEIMIATNIKCVTGKTLIEKSAMGTPGVSTAMVDTDTGILYLILTGTLTSYDDMTKMIRSNGFTADGKAGTGGANPCK